MEEYPVEGFPLAGHLDIMETSLLDVDYDMERILKTLVGKMDI